MFVFLNLPGLVLVNGVSAVLYLICALLVMHDRLHLILLLGLLDCLAFSTVSTLLIGWDTGYYLWLMFAFTLIFLGYAWSQALKLWFSFLTLATALVLIFVVRPLPPIYTIPQAYSELVFLANLGLLFLSNFAVIVNLFRTAEHSEVEALRANNETRTLLFNILPASIAQRLLSSSEPIADAAPHTSIVFTDIVGFTTMASTMSPQKVVELLDEIFSGFDQLVAERGLEKIKTIGDGYLVASGVPHPRDDHALAAVQCSLDLLKYVRELGQRLALPLQLRVGIHSGPLVAGVIGKSRIAYDLWGDTVNTASRMESHGVPGRIQISEATYALVKSEVKVEDRGLLEIKGKGSMRAFLVDA